MEEKHYSFADLFDLDTILEVMKNFYALTSFPPSITDPEGNLMLTVGFKTLCRDFHRSHPETLKQCIESDTWMADRLDAKSGYACYDCLNGLTDVAMPIVIDGRHLANLFIGQFFTEPAPPEEFFLERAERYGFDRDAYMAAVAEIPVFTEAQVEQAATFMTGLAQLIGEMGLSQKRLAELNATPGKPGPGAHHSAQTRGNRPQARPGRIRGHLQQQLRGHHRGPNHRTPSTTSTSGSRPFSATSEARPSARACTCSAPTGRNTQRARSGT